MYPTKEMYEILFAKWLNHETDLLSYANIKKGDRVADFCCGGMRLTKRLHVLTEKDVIAVDESHDMGPSLEDWLKEEYRGIQFYVMTIDDFIIQMDPNEFDTIFCQQAVNYWINQIFDDWNGLKTYFVNGIKPGGQFIFNTFNTCPPEGTTKKEYEYEGRQYTEFNTFYNGQIYHIQMCDNFPPMLTVFDWISPERFSFLLSPYFEVEVFRIGKTDVYRCTRNNQEVLE